MSVSNKRVIYEKVPVGLPVAGQDLNLREQSINQNAPLEPGALLVKNEWVSFDPYQRGRMRDPSIKSYNVPFEPGRVITNSGIAIVVSSANPEYRTGDVLEVEKECGFEEYTVLSRGVVNSLVKKLTNPHNLPHYHFLHSLGMPGLTAYAGLYEIGGPLKPGETIFISSAAGAVGQVVGQIAKRNGLKVIGSVGSDEKLEFLIRECDFDGGFNYKVEQPAAALARLAPGGIDIYWENVGGEQLEAAIQAMNPFGRIVFCGMISQYNLKPEDKYPIKNMQLFVTKRIKAQGFIIADKDINEKWKTEHRDTVSKWIVDGSFKPKVAVTEGVSNAIDGFLGMLQGKNFGKAVLKV